MHDRLNPLARSGGHLHLEEPVGRVDGQDGHLRVGRLRLWVRQRGRPLQGHTLTGIQRDARNGAILQVAALMSALGLQQPHGDR